MKFGRGFRTHAAMAIALLLVVDTPGAQPAAGGCEPDPPEVVERRIAASRKSDTDWASRAWYSRARAACHLSRAGSTLDMTAMLEAEIAGEPSLGAGIVTGVSKDWLVLATPNHVVRRGDAAAQRVRVRFRAWPSQPVSAVVLPFKDTALDLAAIAVALDGASGGPNLAARYRDVRLPEFMFGTAWRFNNNRYVLSDGPAQHRMAVAAIGNLGGQRGWFVPQQTGAVYSVSRDEILFEQQFLTPGFSGGALVDPQGSLLAMVVSDAPPLGKALPMERIREAFRAAGLPFVLRAYLTVLEEVESVGCSRPRVANAAEVEKVNPFVVDCGDNTGDALRRPDPAWEPRRRTGGRDR
jgi:hypothetical protein